MVAIVTQQATPLLTRWSRSRMAGGCKGKNGLMLRRIEHGQTRDGRRKNERFGVLAQRATPPSTDRPQRKPHSKMPGNCERRTAQPRQNKRRALQAGQQPGDGRRIFVYQVFFSKSHNNHINIYVVYLKT